MSKTSAIMFYDGGCPICAREVKLYRRLDWRRHIEFVDVTRDTRLVRALGVEPADALRRLRVLSPDGIMLSGAYAFACLWKSIPITRPLAQALYRLNLLPSIDRLYNWFAAKRHARRCISASRRSGDANCATLSR